MTPLKLKTHLNSALANKAETFLELDDTPSNFTGSANLALRVNSTADGVIFRDDQINAGVGLSGGGSVHTDPTLNLDINSLNETLLTNDSDFIPIHSGGSPKKVSKLNLLSGTYKKAETSIVVKVPTDYPTIQEAIDSFRDIIFSDQAFGYVNILPGVYPISQSITINHPQEGKIVIRSDAGDVTQPLITDMVDDPVADDTTMRNAYDVILEHANPSMYAIMDFRLGQSPRSIENIMFSKPGANGGVGIQFITCRTNVVRRCAFSNLLIGINSRQSKLSSNFNVFIHTNYGLRSFEGSSIYSNYGYSYRSSNTGAYVYSSSFINFYSHEFRNCGNGIYTSLSSSVYCNLGTFKDCTSYGVFIFDSSSSHIYNSTFENVSGVAGIMAYRGSTNVINSCNFTGFNIAVDTQYQSTSALNSCTFNGAAQIVRVYHNSFGISGSATNTGTITYSPPLNTLGNNESKWQ